MKIINIKKINKLDWKKFLIWLKENSLFFEQNFYTKLISFNQEIQYEDNLIEFYLFNKFKLNDKYLFDWPKLIKEINESSIKNWIKSLLKIFFNKDSFNLLFDFFLDLINYLDKNKKDYEEEYKIVEKYWNFIDNLRESKNKNYNYLIEHINKSIHINFKGFRE